MMKQSCFKMVNLNSNVIILTEMSPAFEAFMSILGDKVEIKGWSGFRGGLDTSINFFFVCVKWLDHDEGSTYYTSYRGFEIMFHVVPMLSEDQRRRLVANDKALIYFQEKTPFTCSFRGNVNCMQFIYVNSVAIGIVARPYTIGTITHYRFGCMVRNRVKFEPVIPNEPIG